MLASVDRPFALVGPTSIPAPRGALSEHVFAALRQSPEERSLAFVEPADGDDEAIALFVLQELSYRSVAGADPGWEDDATFLTLRATLERRLEDRLRRRVVEPTGGGSLADAVRSLLDGATGPSLSSWIEESADLDHLREFAVHRAAYQLKEADPHTFALPRLSTGRAKSALLEIQSDEYGRTEPQNAHAALFAATLEALDIDAGAGPDLDRLPASTLTTSTFLNLLGRSRRLTGACLAHLAVFEMTSVEPMARYATAVRRLLPDDTATAAARFFDVHVAADGYHEQIAVDELLAGLEADHPELAEDAFFGAAGLMVVEQDFTDHLLDAWGRGLTSLRAPLPDSELHPAQRLREELVG